jgi:hypothetical protein
MALKQIRADRDQKVGEQQIAYRVHYCTSHPLQQYSVQLVVSARGHVLRDVFCHDYRNTNYYKLLLSSRALRDLNFRAYFILRCVTQNSYAWG